MGFYFYVYVCSDVVYNVEKYFWVFGFCEVNCWVENCWNFGINVFVSEVIMNVRLDLSDLGLVS